MKIAVFHELPEGGALTVVLEMAKRLKLQHTVDLYTTGENKNYKYKDCFTHAYIYPFKEKKWNGKNWKVRLYKDTIELTRLYFVHKKIAKDISQKKYDIFWVNGSIYIEAPFVLSFKNKNKIFYCHDPNYRFVYESFLNISKNLDLIRTLYERINRIIRKYLDIRNIRTADILIASSNFERKIIKKTYNLESVVIPYGIDSTFFTPKNIKKKYDVLYLGASHYLEGYPTLLKIISYLPKYVKVKKILGDIEWISDKKELRSLYQESKMVICLGRNEPFGLTPIDAMACGVPSIAVNEGGYKETVRDGYTGYLLPRNPKLIAEKIIGLLNDGKKLKEFSINSRQEALESWKWEININRLNDLFKSLLK